MFELPFNAEPGRTDVVNTIQDFRFTSGSKSVFKNLTIVDDDVLEFDEIFIAEFSFSPEILYSWNVRLDEPSTAFILIRDDDCELHVQSQDKALCNYITYPIMCVCTLTLKFSINK